MHHSVRLLAVFFIAFSGLSATAFAIVNAQEPSPVVLKLIAEKKFAEAEQWIDKQLVQHPESSDLLALHVKLGIVDSRPRTP